MAEPRNPTGPNSGELYSPGKGPWEEGGSEYLFTSSLNAKALVIVEPDGSVIVDTTGYYWEPQDINDLAVFVRRVAALHKTQK